MYCSYSGTHAWSSKSSLKIQKKFCHVSEVHLFLRFTGNEIVWACFFWTIHFLLFLRDISPAYDQGMRSCPFKSSNLPGENLVKYKHWALNCDWLASLNIFVTAQYKSYLFCLHRVLEFRTHIFPSKSVYHKLPELSSTQVRRLNQPSLQSLTFLSWLGT